MLMCACVLVHVFVCMFKRVCMCACMPCMYAYVCMYACACVCMYVYTCMYVCEYAMHVCVCVHVCLCKCLFPNSGSYRVLVVFQKDFQVQLVPGRRSHGKNPILGTQR